MELITNELVKALPRLCETEQKRENKLLLKFYTPWTYWAWYLSEYDPEERLAFGWIRGFEDEWGYFSMDELEGIRGPQGLQIARDVNFKPVECSRLGGR